MRIESRMMELLFIGQRGESVFPRPSVMEWVCKWTRTFTGSGVFFFVFPDCGTCRLEHEVVTYFICEKVFSPSWLLIFEKV